MISCKEGAQLTKNDYNRAISFLPGKIQEEIYHLDVEPNWLEDSISFWYKTTTQDGITYYLVDLDDLEIVPAFDHERLTDSLNSVFDEKIKREELLIENIEYATADSLGLQIKDREFALHTKSYELKEILNKDHNPDDLKEIISPDGNWSAYIDNYNLFIKSSISGKVFQLSHDGSKNYEYANYYGWDDVIRGERSSRKENFWVEWSPDSRFIYTAITDLRTAKKMYLLDWSIDTLYRPDLLYYYRASPGDTALVYQIPVIFDINTRKMHKVDIPPKAHFNSPELRWSSNGEFLYGRNWHRGYKQIDYIEVNPINGEVRKVGSDSSKTNIEIMYTIFEYSEKSQRLFFTSERSGWNMIYSLDWITGEVKKVTEGDYFVKELKYLDEGNQKLYFTATGREADVNPYLQSLYSIKMDGSDLNRLTKENANHIVSFSTDGKYFVDNYSTLDQPTISVVRKPENGEVILEIGHTDISPILEKGWKMPRSFNVKARDGTTDIYGALWLPSTFNEDESYPIIDFSYTGPHTTVYPKSFSQVIYGSEKQSLAELGFIVMVVDGLGSAMRSKAFHDHSYGKLGYNLQDHVEAIEQLSIEYTWIDKTRVGIYGHSAGGYDAAHALMQFPDFYKVAVSSSADHDHRMEKAWWPEMYMGWPVDSQYHQQSNITLAGNLKGKLLITHGGIDENVNPSATFKLAEALIKADKDFDMLILPGMRHGYYGPHWEYFTKRKWNYFVEHLLDIDPIWEFEF